MTNNNAYIAGLLEVLEDLDFKIRKHKHDFENYGMLAEMHPKRKEYREEQERVYETRSLLKGIKSNLRGQFPELMQHYVDPEAQEPDYYI